MIAFYTETVSDITYIFRYTCKVHVIECIGYHYNIIESIFQSKNSKKKIYYRKLYLLENHSFNEKLLGGIMQAGGG